MTPILVRTKRTVTLVRCEHCDAPVVVRSGKETQPLGSRSRFRIGADQHILLKGSCPRCGALYTVKDFGRYIYITTEEPAPETS